MAQNGNGPPTGSVSDSRYAAELRPGQLPTAIEKQLGGHGAIPLDDPAFQPPSDPLKGAIAGIAKIVYRDLPLVSTIVDWQVDWMRAAVRSHMWGYFESSGQLVDAIIGDDRVQATLASRISGLFGREVRFKPANDSAAAKECLDAWVTAWPGFATVSAQTVMQAYTILMGEQPAQLRKLVAISQDGQLPIIPGNGKWMLHAPHGEYRGWLWGAVRPIAEPWLMRHWALRDWARFSEVHGMPIKKGIVPASSEQGQRDAYEAALSQLSTETTIMVSQGNDGSNKYDFELVEAKDTAWEAFPGLRDHCDMAIVLAIMSQNLTTEVKGGSFAATDAHMDIRQDGLMFDNAAWRWTTWQQVARPFAWLNFGDPDLAPITDYNVTSREEYEHNAKQFQEFGKAVQVLRQGGVKFSDTEQLRKFCSDKFGLDGLPDFEITDPIAPAGGAGGAGQPGGGA